MLRTAPLRLLVVDDSAPFRQTVRQMFDRNKTEVIETDSGEEAARLFAELRPDWVIMDMRMPGGGGVKATEAIRKLDPQARVIIMSQFIEKEFRDQALAAGALEFLDKEELCRLPDIMGVSESKP